MIEPAMDAAEGPGVQEKVVDIGLLPLPELGWAVFAEGIGEAVGTEHRCESITLVANQRMSRSA